MPTITRSLLLTTAVVTAAIALPSASDARALKAIWGPTTLPDGSSAFGVYRDLGVDVLQLQLRWDQVAPTRPAAADDPGDPAYRWPQALDAAVGPARAARVDLALMVRGSPAWANGGRSSQWAPDPAAYAQFLTAASRRYRSVRRWMIWGETNRAAVFQPHSPRARTGPRRYARLLAHAYQALKRRSPRNRVIGGMTFSFGDVLPASWLRWMRLPNGKPPPLDEYGHNPFTRRLPDLRRRGYAGYPGARDLSDVDTFAQEIHRTYRRSYRRFARRGPKLWLSEFTVSSDRPNRAFAFAVSRREQALWLRRAYGIAARNAWISGLGWFGLLDDPVTEQGGLTTGLMTYEGVRKPAYFAYRDAR
jgi:hypothetical protein